MKKDVHIPEKKNVQLQMVWPISSNKPFTPRVPNGYMLRTYRPGDEKGYVKVMGSAGFKKWKQNLDGAMNTALNKGIFFVFHKKTGKIVATAAAQHSPRKLHPFGGQLGWVGVDPAHRGKRLGSIVSASATKRLLEAGYEDLYLLTDDWRLPAIKTYLTMGFVPLLFERGIKERWIKIFKKLGVSFSKILFVSQ